MKHTQRIIIKEADLSVQDSAERVVVVNHRGTNTDEAEQNNSSKVEDDSHECGGSIDHNPFSISMKTVRFSIRVISLLCGIHDTEAICPVYVIYAYTKSTDESAIAYGLLKPTSLIATSQIPLCPPSQNIKVLKATQPPPIIHKKY